MRFYMKNFTAKARRPQSLKHFLFLGVLGVLAVNPFMANFTAKTRRTQSVKHCLLPADQDVRNAETNDRRVAHWLGWQIQQQIPFWWWNFKGDHAFQGS